MTDDPEARLAALRAEGWTLISAPSPDEQHERSRITAPFVMERYWSGRPIRENGHSLQQVLEMATWQQQRLEALETPRPAVIEHVATTDNYLAAPRARPHRGGRRRRGGKLDLQGRPFS